MSWTAFHHRGDVLRRVADEADLRRDGTLPWHLIGVAETFHDHLDLIGALQLRWYTRLSGRIEREIHEQLGEGSADQTVRRAWLATAQELPGIRAILDRQAESPEGEEIAAALARARAKEHDLLARMSGRASGGDAIEDAARSAYRPGEAMPERRFVKVPSGSAAFVARAKAVLAGI